MAEEYPKALYRPDDGKMVTAGTREQEIDILESWGMELPVIPLSGGADEGMQDADTSEVDALRAEIEDLKAKGAARAEKAAEKLAKAERAGAAANKRANEAEAKLAAAQKIIVSMTKAPETAPGQSGSAA